MTLVTLGKAISRGYEMLQSFLINKRTGKRNDRRAIIKVAGTYWSLKDNSFPNQSMD